MTFRRVILPLALPAVVAGSIFTFSLTLGDYIAPDARLEHAVHRQRRLRQRRHREQPAARGGVRDGAGPDHDRLPPDRAPAGRVRVALMHLSDGMRWVLRVGTAITLAFIYIPLIVIAIYAFNESRSQAWPIDGFTLEWFEQGVRQPGRARRALDLAQGRARRDGDRAAARHAGGAGRRRATASSAATTISFLVILPLALPGIVTGMALNATFTQVLGRRPDAVHGDRRPRHLLHRRRLQQRDRAAAAHGRARSRRRRWTSAPTAGRRSGNITLPVRCAPRSWPARCSPSRSRSTRSSSPRSRPGSERDAADLDLHATTRGPNQLPIVNVVGLLVILLSIIPVYFANRLYAGPGRHRGRARGGRRGRAVASVAGKDAPGAPRPDRREPGAGRRPPARTSTAPTSPGTGCQPHHVVVLGQQRGDAGGAQDSGAIRAGGGGPGRPAPSHHSSVRPAGQRAARWRALGRRSRSTSCAPRRAGLAACRRLRSAAAPRRRRRRVSSPSSTSKR